MTQTEMIEIINKMDNDQQNQFYNSLRAAGLNEDEILAIQATAFFSKLFSNPDLFHAVRAEMGHQLYRAFTK